MRRLLVTGGLGFIGSHFVDRMLKAGHHVTNIDKVTYAARPDFRPESPRYQFIQADICTLEHLPPEIDVIVNFAAESHVDNSIVANHAFFESNIRGVHNILELLRSKDSTDRPTFIHISTDEVYGSIKDGHAKVGDCLHPSSPYSATKAAADDLIHAWNQTYGIQYKIIRSCNNYGIGQYPEKLFSKTFDRLMRDMKMTVHGNGSYRREWLHVSDNCAAIERIMEKGAMNTTYNVSSNEEYSVLEVVKMIIAEVKPGDAPEQWIEFIDNRLGQDIRYSVDASETLALGWKPAVTLPSYIALHHEMLRAEEAKQTQPRHRTSPARSPKA